jgi:hypothetical protein
MRIRADYMVGQSAEPGATPDALVPPHGTNSGAPALP